MAAPLFFFDYFAYKVRSLQIANVSWLVKSVEIADRGLINFFMQLYFKTKIVKPSDMDFSPAYAFDEQHRINAAQQNAQHHGYNMGEEKEKKNSPWMKRVKYLVFG